MGPVNFFCAASRFRANRFGNLFFPGVVVAHDVLIPGDELQDEMFADQVVQLLQTAGSVREHQVP
jgi:hypothetical protein